VRNTLCRILSLPEVQSFTGKNARELITEPLVLAEHEADFPSAHADIAGGNPKTSGCQGSLMDGI